MTEPRRLSRGCRIALLGCGGLGALCFVVLAGAMIWLFGGLRDPERLEAIADFSVPSGYSMLATPPVQGLRTATFMPGPGAPSRMVIVCMAADRGSEVADSATLRDAALEAAMAASSRAGGLASASLAETRRQPVTVNGAPAALSLIEGRASTGEVARAAVVPFEGRGGPAAVAFYACPEAEWNQAVVDSFARPAAPRD